MLNADQRGFMEASERVNRGCLMPWASICTLAEAVYDSLKARGWAYIDPKAQFVDGFVRQFSHSQHRIDAVA